MALKKDLQALLQGFGNELPGIEQAAGQTVNRLGQDFGITPLLTKLKGVLAGPTEQSHAQAPAVQPPFDPKNPPPYINKTFPSEDKWVEEQMKRTGKPAYQIMKQYYDAVTAPGGVYSSPTPGKSVLGAQTQVNMSPLEQQTIDTFKQHGIHPAVAYGIAEAEGGKIGQNNLWNINAVDSNPSLATNYPDTLSAASSAAKLMQSMLVKKGALNKDPDTQLSAIESSGYAGDPSTWKDRSLATGGAGQYFDHWSDFVKATPSYQKWAGN